VGERKRRLFTGSSWSLTTHLTVLIGREHERRGSALIHCHLVKGSALTLILSPRSGHPPCGLFHGRNFPWSGAVFPIPRGLRLSAQGCEAPAFAKTLRRGRRATLGNPPVRYQPQPGLRLVRVGIGATPLGLAIFPTCLPRVAHSSQPWALGRNPFGILLLLLLLWLPMNCARSFLEEGDAFANVSTATT
jgi:hypothetical protein